MVGPVSAAGRWRRAGGEGGGGRTLTGGFNITALGSEKPLKKSRTASEEAAYIASMPIAVGVPTVFSSVVKSAMTKGNGRLVPSSASGENHSRCGAGGGLAGTSGGGAAPAAPSASSPSTAAKIELEIPLRASGESGRKRGGGGLSPSTIGSSRVPLCCLGRFSAAPPPSEDARLPLPPA